MARAKSVWFKAYVYNRVYIYANKHWGGNFSAACMELLRKGLDALKPENDLDQLRIALEAYRQECHRLAEKIDRLERSLSAPLADIGVPTSNEEDWR